MKEPGKQESANGAKKQIGCDRWRIDRPRAILALAPLVEPRTRKAVCSGRAELESIVARVSRSKRRGKQYDRAEACKFQ